MIHGEYQVNLELGEVLLSAHVGIAEFLPARSTGWYAAFGFGYTFSVAGGGSL